MPYIDDHLKLLAILTHSQTTPHMTWSEWCDILPKKVQKSFFNSKDPSYVYIRVSDDNYRFVCNNGDGRFYYKVISTTNDSSSLDNECDWIYGNPNAWTCALFNV